MRVKSDQPIQALLLQPPPGDITGPYPALCYLKSFAARRGYEVRVKDLGIEALLHLSQPERVAKMLQAARSLCDQLETSPVLDAGQQQQYNLLLASLAAQDRPQWYAESIQSFRRSEEFFDYNRYKQARAGLNTFFELLSALHHPTVLTAAEYPTATMLKTMEAILAHQDPAVNPYIRYYEDILFPAIADQGPALVGISMVFANQSVQALVLGRMIKERFPDIHVTLGGAYLSQWVMAAGDQQVEQLLGCADSIVCGEGEQAFTELLERILAGQDPSGLPNLVCRRKSDQKLVRFEQLNYTDIADQPPPDFSDLDLDAYLVPQTIIPYCISRGCYWGRCVFCQNRYGDYRMRRYQTVSVEKAVAEMRLLADRYGSHHFNFSNDVVDPAYLKKLSRAMLDSGSSFVWNTDLRAEKAFDAATCRLMADAGLKTVAIGFESGCQKTLDAMDKGKRVETTAEVMGNLYAAGIATQAMGIFGMPGESEAEGQETVRFLEANAEAISYYVMGLLMVLPGSRMHSDPGAYGVTAISYDRNPLKTPEPVWWSDSRMSMESVNRLYARLNHLEEIYAIDEYPYVGGLSTNHGFLYFTLGPDILKRLRRDELAALERYYRELGLDGPPPTAKSLRSLIPRRTLPSGIYRSRYMLQRFPMEAGAMQDTVEQSPGNENTFLLLPASCQQAPVLVGQRETSLLNRIDGRRNLKAVLKKVDNAQLKPVLSFIWYLVQTGAIEFI
jgi:anaerobic magnesium-protoporphyrin IX monomethyl ester cyclase